MKPAQAHEILIFCPVTGVTEPQPTVKGFENGVGLLTVGTTVLTDELGDACGKQVGTVVIGRAMGHRTTIVP